jgi:uncharacterized protein (TIGR03382 family)
VLAFAAVLLTAAPASAQDFVRTHVPGRNVCLWWSNRAYTFNVDAAGYTKNDSTSSPRAEFAAIDAAIQTWQTVSNGCSDFVFTRGPDVDRPKVGYVQDGENANVVTFREVSCATTIPEDDPCYTEGGCRNLYRCWDHDELTIALTTTTHRVASGVILDADIEFNAAVGEGGFSFLFSTVNSPPCPEGSSGFDCVANDVQNTFTHEVGHAIGLDHSESFGSTMEATAPLGETKKRIIDSGTAEGFCTIYPRSGATDPMCEETGEVVSEIVVEGRGSPGFTTAGCSAVGGGSLASVAVGLLAVLARRRRTGGAADDRSLRS